VSKNDGLLGVPDGDINISGRALFPRPDPTRLAPPTRTRLETILDLIEAAKKIKEENQK
jgi:hypothetical protein